MRRQEKWNQRQKACERINEMFGTNLTCISVIDVDMAGSVEDATGEENVETEEEA